MDSAHVVKGPSGRRSEPETAESVYHAEEARCWSNAAIAYGKAAAAASSTYPLAEGNGELISRK